MFKKVVFLQTILLTLLCMTVSGVIAQPKRANLLSSRAVYDSLVYSHLFRLISGMDRSENEQDSSFIKSYLTSQAGLSEEDFKFLKTLSNNFADNIDSVYQDESLKLSLSYKKRLKNFFGPTVFQKFQSLVESQIISNIRITRVGNRIMSGSSGIMLDESLHQLRGISVTSYSSRPANLMPPCGASVSATMSGPGVSVSGSSSDCVPDPIVTLTATYYQPNAEYCIFGSHSSPSDGGSSSMACLTTPNTPRVNKLEYEQILTDDLPLDTNPSTNPGGGARIFPDKKTPTETVDRRKIRVKA